MRDKHKAELKQIEQEYEKELGIAKKEARSNGIFKCIYCANEFQANPSSIGWSKRSGVPCYWCSRTCVMMTYSEELCVSYNDMKSSCREKRKQRTFYNSYNNHITTVPDEYDVYDPETGQIITLKNLIGLMWAKENTRNGRTCLVKCRYGNEDCINITHLTPYTTYMQTLDSLPREAKYHFGRRYLFEANQKLALKTLEGLGLSENLINLIKEATDYNIYGISKEREKPKESKKHDWLSDSGNEF